MRVCRDLPVGFVGIGSEKSVDVAVRDINADCEPPLAREGIDASRIMMFLGVIMLLVALLGGCELGTVKFVLVLTPTDSFSRSTCMKTIKFVSF